MQFRIVFRPALDAWVIEVASGIGFRTIASQERRSGWFRKPRLFSTHDEAIAHVEMVGLAEEYNRVGIRHSTTAQLMSIPSPAYALDAGYGTGDPCSREVAASGSTTQEVTYTLRETAKGDFLPPDKEEGHS